MVNAVAIGLYMTVVAVICLSFLVEGVTLRGGAVRASATIMAVEQVRDSAFRSHEEFTLRFTGPHGRPVTEQTEQVSQAPPVPGPGDHVEIYYQASDPANLSDVRFGSPGRYDFLMSAVFGGLLSAGILLILAGRVVRSRRAARRESRPGQDGGAGHPHRGAARRAAATPDDLVGEDDPSFIPGLDGGA